MKRLSIWFAFLLTFVVFNSCLEDKKVKDPISETAKITNFSLKGNDTVKKYVFSINQDSLLIYNADSMPMNTRIDSLYAVIKPKFHKVYINDSIDLYKFDTLWLNFENEIRYTVVAADKKTEATYRLQINRHTVDPDTMVWEGVNSEIFSGVATDERVLLMRDTMVYITHIGGNINVRKSVDGKVWRNVAVSGLPTTIETADCYHAVSSGEKLYMTIDSTLYTSADAAKWTAVETSSTVDRLLYYMDGVLYGVIIEEGSQQLAALEGNTWNMKTTLPSSFPVGGEAVCVGLSPTRTSRVFVLGGIDAEGNCLSSTWSTENGSYWSNLSPGEPRFTPRSHAAIAQYASHLMVFGGRNTGGAVVSDEMWSKDYGMNWDTISVKMALPQMYVRRYDHSAVVTSGGMIYLVGGRASDDTQIADVWRGINYASMPGFKR